MSRILILHNIKQNAAIADVNVIKSDIGVGKQGVGKQGVGKQGVGK